jgi:hypothetical protein
MRRVGRVVDGTGLENRRTAMSAGCNLLQNKEVLTDLSGR